MARGMKIPKHKKESITDKLIKYNKPKFVYIPLIIQNDDNITVFVKKGDYIHKGDIVAKSKGVFRTPIHSSVSGIVQDYTEKYYLNGELVKCLVIENDYKEEVKQNKENRKVINNFTKEEFVKKIQEAGIVGLGGGGFPTFVKYDHEKPIKTLLINAVECEPYITADLMLVKNKCEEILEAIDAILEINHIPEAIIAIKKDNHELKDTFMNFIGTYLKIKLVEVPSIYPMGWERSLVKQIKKVNYKKYPLEKGIIVNNISTIFAIYETLKFDKPLIERVITISGNGIKNPQNILVKIGTEAKELIQYIGGYSNVENIKFIAGGPMMGVTIKNDELVVSSNLTSITIMEDLEEEVPSECLRCGKCVIVCPAKLSPVLIKDSLKKPENLDALRPELCVECGLCSYTCPAKINVRLCVKTAKRMREGVNK